MSGLQEKAKPFLVPMLNGEKVLFYKKGQTALATWVAMFVMVAEFGEPDMVAISAEERSRFMETLRAPSHWRIWIGHHKHSLRIGRWFHCVIPLAKQDAEIHMDDLVPRPNTQTSTLLLGKHLVIHVMSSPVIRRVIRRYRHIPQIAPKVSQIWPVVTRRVEWPPAELLSDADVLLMADDFFNRADRIARRSAGLE